MSSLEPSGPNAEQIKYWNERGREWVTQQDLIDDMIRPLGLLAMDRAHVQSGEHVLDVGCGCGDTTVELGRRVGTTGSVLGVDISTAMLERARETARTDPVSNVGFENADAQTHSFPPGMFDLLFSRFGVMFFADPTAAFTNLRAALRPGGRVAFVAWQPLQMNPWMFMPLMAALQHVALPPPPPPDAPGPFSFGDPERVRRLLTGAGFADFNFEALNETIRMGGGGGLETTVNFLMQLGPTAAALREVDTSTRGRVMAAVREALEPYVTPEGIRMGAAAWVVTAHRPL